MMEESSHTTENFYAKDTFDISFFILFHYNLKGDDGHYPYPSILNPYYVGMFKYFPIFRGIALSVNWT